MAALAAAAALAACSAPPSPAASAVIDPNIHKIQHVVVIQQENRSFDSYFGTYPGADGIPMTGAQPGPCLPAAAGAPCVRPFVDHADVNGGGPHGQDNATADIDGGTMDGFITQASAAKKGCTDPNNPPAPTRPPRT